MIMQDGRQFIQFAVEFPLKSYTAVQGIFFRGSAQAINLKLEPPQATQVLWHGIPHFLFDEALSQRLELGRVRVEKRH